MSVLRPKKGVCVTHAERVKAVSKGLQGRVKLCVTERVVALAKWRKAELVTAILSYCALRYTTEHLQQSREICTLMSTYELKNKNPRDTN